MTNIKNTKKEAGIKAIRIDGIDELIRDDNGFDYHFKNINMAFWYKV